MTYPRLNPYEPNGMLTNRIFDFASGTTRFDDSKSIAHAYAYEVDPVLDWEGITQFPVWDEAVPYMGKSIIENKITDDVHHRDQGGEGIAVSGTFGTKLDYDWYAHDAYTWSRGDYSEAFHERNREGLIGLSSDPEEEFGFYNIAECASWNLVYGREFYFWIGGTFAGPIYGKVGFKNEWTLYTHPIPKGLINRNNEGKPGAMFPTLTMFYTLQTGGEVQDLDTHTFNLYFILRHDIDPCFPREQGIVDFPDGENQDDWPNIPREVKVKMARV